MAAWSAFPSETILHVLRYSSPRDVVRWRAVSKWFRDITCDASIWKDLYTNSYLPRPPGPFPFQSTAYLEQALVQTENLAQSWTTRPMRVVSHVELRTRRDISTELLNGRWLVGREWRKHFVLHDTVVFAGTSSSQKKVIWEQENLIMNWATASTTMKDGQFVLYVLFSEMDARLSRPVWSLIGFRLDGESGEPYDIGVFEVPEPPLAFEVDIQGGKSPFLYVWYRRLVFDTRTDTFYELPEFRIALDETWRKISADFEFFSSPASVVLTRTHVIVVHQSPRSMALIQAFTTDGSSVRNGKHFLRLSHEGVSNHHLPNATLLRNSIVDPVTGSTGVRLLNKQVGQPSIVLSDLSFPKPAGDDVLPIIILTDEKIARTLCEHGVEGPHCEADGSDAGYLRGFYIKYHDPQFCLGHFDAFSVMKFVVNATQDECKLAFGELLPPKPNHMGSPGFRTAMTFDGARGRLCFVKSFEGEEQVVVVADIE